MPIPLPDLDDRTFDDLVAEARSLIPANAPEWTDHNPSDPGITLLELFAWLTEMLLFRANQVPPRHVETFLRLLNGPGWQPGPDLDEAVATTIRSLRQRDRAVTREDYEELALEASPRKVARAHCVPGRDITPTTEPQRLAHREGHVSVVLVPREAKRWRPLPRGTPVAAAASSDVRDKVLEHLDERRLLTTRHHVDFPVKAPVAAAVLVAHRPDVRAQTVRGAVKAALDRFLDPLRGGPDETGWPFERPVYVSELYELLGRLPDIEYVPDVWLESSCPAGEPDCAPAAEIWNDDGDLVGLRIEAHQLPDARIDPPERIDPPNRIVTATRFLPVSITVSVRSKGDPAEIRRKVKQSLRRLFHPLYKHGSPPSFGPPRPIELEDVSSRARNVSEVTSVAGVELASDPARETRDRGTVVEVLVEPGELVDARIAVTVEGAKD